MTALLNALKTRDLDLATTLAGQGENLPATCLIMRCGNCSEIYFRQKLTRCC